MRVPGPHAPSAPFAARSSSQPASQAASGSAALFPPPSHPPEPLRGRPATAPPRGPEADQPRSRGEPRLGLPPNSSACLVIAINPCRPRHRDDYCHLVDGSFEYLRPKHFPLGQFSNNVSFLFRLGH